MRLAALALGAALLALPLGLRAQEAAPAAAGEEPRARPPDVLLIVLDDVNDWVGYLGGHPGGVTPAIDALAARGLAFTNAHCPAPVCCPSRTAMLSGLRACASPAKPNTSWTELVAEDQTLTAHFRANGYRVLGCGKVYHGENERAFDEYFAGQDDYEEARQRRSHGVAKLNGLKTHLRSDVMFDWGPIDAEPQLWRDHQLASWAAERLMEDGDQPLFLAVGFCLPHLPWFVPRAYFERFPRESMQLPEVREHDEDDLPAGALELLNTKTHDKLVAAHLWPDAIQAYMAAMAFNDEQVGRVLAALEQSPRRDRTIVVLVSDHGWHLGEKWHWRKATLWEPSTRIPLVFAAPGLEHAGSTCSRPVDSLSTFATLCDLTGLPTPEHVQGPSLLPLLQDPGADWPHLALTTMRDNHSVRSERYRLTRYADGSLELYDLASDPGEFENRADDPELTAVRDDLVRRLELLLRPGAR